MNKGTEELCSHPKLSDITSKEIKNKSGLAPTYENYSIYLMALEMRKRGRSIQSISDELHTEKRLIEPWVSHVKLTKYQKKCLDGGVSTKFNKGREKAAEINRKKYADLRENARQKGFKEACGDPLHLAGCMLYWAEGSKTINSVVFSNTDFLMHKKFISFLRYLGVENNKIKFSTRVHNTVSNATHEECKFFWSEILNLPKEEIKVYDANDNRGKAKPKSRYPFGVGRIEVYDYTVVQRIYGGLEKYVGSKMPYGRK